MASRDPEIASQAARIAALANLAQTPRHVLVERLNKARAAQHQQDLDAVDPHGVLDPEERERRAAFRRRERLSRAGLASARARKAKAVAAKESAKNAELDQLIAAEGAA